MSVLDDLANELHNTPSGKAEWAKILKPDYKYDKDGTYSIDHYLESDPAQKIIEVLRVVAQKKAELDDAAAYAPPPFIKDEKTGIYCFKYRQSAIGRPHKGEPFDIKVDVFDAKMNHWPKDVLIGNGSIVKVCFSLYPWNVAARGGVGITLRLKAVQIIDHVPYEAEEKTYGFEEEDGVDMGGANGNGAQAKFGADAVQEKPKEESKSEFPYKDYDKGPVEPSVPF